MEVISASDLTRRSRSIPSVTVNLTLSEKPPDEASKDNHLGWVVKYSLIGKSYCFIDLWLKELG
jgi:hypothetical protein